MSFGYSVGDAILLTQLAWRTVQDTRQACGEHDELTREVSSLHKVLERLQRELANPESPLNHADDSRRKELNEVGSGCEQILKVMDSIVTKYNALSEDKRSGKKLWQKIKFGNGEVKDLPDLRLKVRIPRPFLCPKCTLQCPITIAIFRNCDANLPSSPEKR